MMDTKDRIEVILKNDNNSDDGVEISLREIIEILIQRKKIIIAFTLVALFSSIIAVYFIFPMKSIYKSTVKMVIQYNYKGIEQGLDPYGVKLDTLKVKSPVVLNSVVDKLKLDKQGITAEAIMQNLEIDPIVPGSVVKKILQQEEVKKDAVDLKEKNDYYYFPSQYVVTLSVPKSFKFEEKRSRQVLTEIVKSYEEYFNNSYSDKNILANAIGKIEYKEYDYPEISLILNNQVELMRNYLNSKKDEAPEFRAKTTGVSFIDIIESMSVLNSVDIARLNSLISAFNLTKNKEKLIKIYEYKIESGNLNSSKKDDEAKVSSEMMSKFQKDKNSILIPGINDLAGSKDTKIENENTNKFYDELAKRATNAGVDSKNAQHDVEFFKAQLEKLKNDNVSQEQKDKALKEVDVLVLDIKSKMENWIKITNNTIDEYYDIKFQKEGVKELSPSEVYGVTVNNSMLVVLIAVFIGAILGIFAAFLKEYWEKSAKTRAITI